MLCFTKTSGENMAISGFDQRQREIREYHKEYSWFYRILVGTTLVLIGIWIGSHLFAYDDGYKVNLYTEGLSVVVTVLILNAFARRREVRQLQEQLIRNAASTSNVIAKDAVHQLRRQGWLQGEKGLLQGKDLGRADLSGADLRDAYLSGVGLLGANLSGALLASAKFDETTIIPDGSNWTLDTDIKRFTNPDHPNFWHPEED
jgi:hypothetical protein